MYPPAGERDEYLAVFGERTVEALKKQLLCHWCRRTELERPQWAHFWKDGDQKAQQSRAESRVMVFSPPLFLVRDAIHTIQELTARDARQRLLDFLLLLLPGDLGHLRNQVRDAKSNRSDGQVFFGYQVVERHAIRLFKGLRDDPFRHLEADVVVVALRRIVAGCALHDVEGELSLQVPRA